MSFSAADPDQLKNSTLKEQILAQLRTEVKCRNPLIAGRFQLAPCEIMKEINASITYDKILYNQDIKASIAHCSMLSKQGIITTEEGDEIIKGLQIILQEIKDGKFKFKTELEDIHMNIEFRLHQLIGELAGKLHTARSRNDQVTTDFKMWIRDAINTTITKLHNLQLTIVNLAQEHYDTIMPGLTHLQIAQPVTFGHHMLAYYEMFRRDMSRFQDAKKRMNECPLGAAALAGTSFAIDREYTAMKLGFDAPTSNSIDSVSDRDFAIEFLSAASVFIMHLSRLAEEIILWYSPFFRFIELSETMTTGSSIMPQKRNPDAAEIIRSKTGRIFSSLNGLLIVMSRLPLAYNKDMQEDKEPVFSTTKDLYLCIDAMQGMLSGIKINKDEMHKAAGFGYSTATDVADWLVKHLNLPFRHAHKITGKLVQIAEMKKCQLQELSLAEIQQVDDRITSEILMVMSVENSTASKTSYGGTCPQQVMEMAKRANSYLEGANYSN